MSKAVELTVHGQRCRVVTSASEQELKALAGMVEAKLDQILKPGRPVTTQAMLLAAVSLANDVVEERQRAEALADKATGALNGLLQRVDEALAVEDAATVISKTKRSAAKRRRRAEAVRPAAATAKPAATTKSTATAKPTTIAQPTATAQQGEHHNDS